MVKNIVSRKLLNLALRYVGRHVDKQDDISLLKYDRRFDRLSPVVWRARSISRQESEIETNDWPALEDLCDYSGKTVVDVGANSGVLAGEFAKLAHEVYAFEPHPKNFADLSDQIKIRSIENIKTFQMAISNFSGETQLIEREAHGIHSLGPHNRGRVISRIPVQVETLDNFWRKKGEIGIALLKIDVEGFELEVLEGARNLLLSKSVEAIVFEFSPRIHKMRGIELDAPLTFLKSVGYEIFDKYGKPFDLMPTSYPRVCDLIAVPKKVDTE